MEIHVTKRPQCDGQPYCGPHPAQGPWHSSRLARMHGTITWQPLVPLLCQFRNDCVNEATSVVHIEHTPERNSGRMFSEV